MDLALQGHRVLITAGAAGIGRAMAEAFLAEGARVHICDIDPQALADFRTAHPAAGATQADVASRSDVAALFAAALADLGGLDTLVNNAGIAGPTGPVDEIAPEDWDRTLEVCLTGQFNCARLAVPHLKASANPSILNLSSVAGKYGFGLRSPYAAAKWGVIGFTKSLSIELGPAGIRVNAILPGLVAGDRQRRVLEAKAQRKGVSFAEMERQAFAYTSIKDYVTAADLGAYACFLASRHGRTVSGQALAMDGDMQMLT